MKWPEMEAESIQRGSTEVDTETDKGQAGCGRGGPLGPG